MSVIEFSKLYKICIFISTSNCFNNELNVIGKRFFNLFNEDKYKLTIGASFSKYDAIIEVSSSSIRKILPKLIDTIENSKKEFLEKNQKFNICYSYVFTKEIISNLDTLKIENEKDYSITCYTFIRVNDVDSNFENILFQNISLILPKNNEIVSKLFWNMNIFSYILIIRGDDFFIIKDFIFKLFSSIEDKKNIIYKTSTIFNLNWDFDKFQDDDSSFKTDNISNQKIKFMTKIDVNSDGLKNLRYYKNKLVDYCNDYKGEINMDYITIKPGWYDLILFGDGKNLFLIKKFIYYLKSFKFEKKFTISETATNLIS